MGRDRRLRDEDNVRLDPVDAAVQVDAADIDGRHVQARVEPVFDENTLSLSKEISRLKRRKAVREGYRKLLFYSFVLILICAIVFLQLRPSQSYTVESRLRDLITASTTTDGTPFENINTLGGVMSWIIETLPDMVWPNATSINDTVTVSQVLSDGRTESLSQDPYFLRTQFNIPSGQAILLSGVLLRQNRFATGRCSVSPEVRELLKFSFNNTFWEMECLQDSLFTGGIYTSRSVLENHIASDANDTALLSKFPTSAFVDAFEYNAYHEFSGFNLFLGTLLSPDDFRSILSLLPKYHWFGSSTLEVKLHFPLLNYNYGRLIFACVSFHQDKAGSWSCYVDTYSIRLDLYYLPISVFRGVLEVIFLCFVLWVFVSEVIRFLKYPREYFSTSFSYISLSFVLLSVACIVLWIKIVTVNMQIVHAKPGTTETIVLGQILRGLTELYSSCSCVMIVSLFFRNLFYLQFQPKLSQFIRTLSRAAVPLTNFILIFLFLFIGMAFIANIIFGHTAHSYQTMMGSIMSCFSMLLSGGDWESLHSDSGPGEVTQVLAYIFFICFNLFCTWIMINMFVAIILNSYDSVSEEQEAAARAEELATATFVEDIKILGGDIAHGIKRRWMLVSGRFKGTRSTLSPEERKRFLEDPVRKELLHFKYFPEGDILRALEDIQTRHRMGITAEDLFKELKACLVKSKADKHLVLRGRKRKDKQQKEGQGDGQKPVKEKPERSPEPSFMPPSSSEPSFAPALAPPTLTPTTLTSEGTPVDTRAVLNTVASTSSADASTVDESDQSRGLDSLPSMQLVPLANAGGRFRRGSSSRTPPGLSPSSSFNRNPGQLSPQPSAQPAGNFPRTPSGRRLGDDNLLLMEDDSSPRSAGRRGSSTAYTPSDSIS